MSCKQWLLQNGYPDYAALIDKLEAENKERGVTTRRDWWDILSGIKDGKPSTRMGGNLPVLRAFQVRQGKPVTANAEQRNENEVAPPKTPQGRWTNRPAQNSTAP
ncbi:MAG: hypothetical protein JW384_02241 [Nitrosomonadaceae bacterium]|nr:hypothetical protein [Nitrosomonadaceae bacterium]